jgi:hypothetical protein
VWARLPAYVVEDGMVPTPRPGSVLQTGLALLRDVAEADGNPAVQEVEGDLLSVGHLAVVHGGALVLVVMPDAEPLGPRDTHVRLTGEVVVEPYLWGPGPVRDSFPDGWARWTVVESYAVPSSRGGEPAWIALLKQEPRPG